MKFNCPYLQKCSGCYFKSETFEDQKLYKISLFKDNFLNQIESSPDCEFVFPVEGYHRHRGDFIISNNKVCLYDEDRKLLPINSCSLLVPAFQELIEFISQIAFNLKNKGTIRLRLAPDGKFGVWLDFANIEIKRLLDEESALQSLLAKGIFVEIGQKGKRLSVSGDNKLKLSDPDPQAWFSTKLGSKEVALYTLVSSFTQPSYALNILMLDKIKNFLELKNNRFPALIEFGSGVGNFSLFLSSYCDQLYLIENDSRNLIALEKNLITYKLENRAKVISSEKQYSEMSRQSENLVFVNPPKSGVGKLFDSPIVENQVIYISCYLDSMKRDLDKLFKQGFKLKKTVLFDQFPQSHHFETLSYLERS